MQDRRCLSDAVLRTLDDTRPTEVAARALELIRSSIGLESARLWLIDFSFETLVDATGSGAALSVESTTAGKVAWTDSPQIEGDTAFIPVSQRGQVIGILELKGPDPRATCEAAGSAAVAIAHALIGSQDYSDAIERTRGAGRLTLPATIQHELLPSPTYSDGFTELAGRLEPAYDVAGDLFDYAVNPEGLHLAVFDAVGHGLHSTTLSTLAVGAYRLHRRRGAGLDEIADQIDRTVRAEADYGDFVTGLLVQTNLAENRMVIWNCGHPAPLMLRDGELRRLESGSGCRPFGLGPLDGHEDIHELKPGDVLVLYTDGVVEARDPDRLDFGLDRLEDMVVKHLAEGIKLPVAAKRVLDSVTSYVGDHLADDATLLLVRFKTDQPERTP